MAHDELTALLGGWEGYRITACRRREPEPGERGRPAITIELEPVPERPKRCSGCGQPVQAVHDVTSRTIRDLPILDADTQLIVLRCRLACPRCGPRIEALDWLDPYARHTRRLAESVARLCAVLPIRHVAAFFGLGWDAVKQIDRQYLERTLGPVDLEGVEAIAIDEFALQKGHRYATVVVDPATKRVLWVGRGRSREDVRPFFEALGPDGRARLKAVAMDMNGAYEQAGPGAHTRPSSTTCSTSWPSTAAR